MNTLKKIILIIILLPLAGCSKWLNLQPENQATEKQLFAEGDGYRTVLNGLYKKMGEKNLYGVELQFGIIDCVAKQYSIQKSSMGGGVDEKYVAAKDYKFNDITLSPTIDAIWLSGYNVISGANNLIQNISNESPSKFELGEIEKNMIIGEAYACRALMHFDLLRVFAPALINDDGKTYLPYVDTYPNIQANGIAVKPFIDKVIEDLKKAAELTIRFDTSTMGRSFSASGNARFYRAKEYGWDEYLNVNDFFKSRGYRLSYYAIVALQARVYQYAGMYEESFQAADKVLNYKAVAPNGSSYDMFSNDDFGGFAWESDFNGYRDLKVVSNLIFGVYNEKSYTNNGLSHLFATKTDGISEGGWLQIDINNQKFFENSQNRDIDEREADLRHSKLVYYVDGYRPISAKWYLSSDTKIRDNNITIMPVIRATEMKYIIAEYYARKGEFGKAYSILNQVRVARSAGWESLPELETTNSFNSFQRDLIGDACREWLGEGQMYYLYKRLNANVNMGEGVVRPLSRAESILPIPTNQSL